MQLSRKAGLERRAHWWRVGGGASIGTGFGDDATGVAQIHDAPSHEGLVLARHQKLQPVEISLQSEAEDAMLVRSEQRRDNIEKLA